MNFQRLYCLNLVHKSSLFDKGIIRIKASVDTRKSNCIKFCIFRIQLQTWKSIRKEPDLLGISENNSVTQFPKLFNGACEESSRNTTISTPKAAFQKNTNNS